LADVKLIKGISC